MNAFYFLLIPLIFAASPLNPVKTDSPRDTMRTFYEAMTDYEKGVNDGNYLLKRRLYDATRCFASAPTQGITSQFDRDNAAIFLKETLDRVIHLQYDLIPDSSTKTRWRLKDTELVIRQVQTGDRQGEWLITYDTWSRAKEFYKKVEHLPFLDKDHPGAGYRPPWLEKLLPKWAQDSFFGLKKWQWLGIFVALFLGFLMKLLLQSSMQLFDRTAQFLSSRMREQALQTIGKPLGLIGATGVWYFSLLFLKIDGLVFGVLNGVIQVIFGFSLIWLCYKLIDVASVSLMRVAERTESTLDDQLVPFAVRTLKVASALLGVLMVLQNMGINVFSLLAGLGLGGLAFALAAKDTAANLFGSIMILVDRPFKIGDWIIVDSVEGNVEEIGFRSTRVRTFYNSVVTVPNSIVATAKVDNMGEREYRRTVEILGVDYDTPPERLEAFMQGIREILMANEHVRKDYFNVVFSGYGDSSLKVMVYFFLVTDVWYKELIYKQNIFLEIFRLAKDLNVSFAFPTQTVHLVSSEGYQPGDLPNEELAQLAKAYGHNGEKSMKEGMGLYSFDPPSR